MFKLGDVVRLSRGWTPMIVIALHKNGTLTAKYANNCWDRVKRSDYNCKANRSYSVTNSYTRAHSGFVPWTGAPISKENFIMPTRYKSKNQPHIAGEFLNNTRNGDVVIETDHNGIIILKADEAVLDIPTTFKVQSCNNRNYTAHYILPKGVTFTGGELLISDSGNIYVVTKLDTEAVNNKGVFCGKQIQTMDL